MSSEITTSAPGRICLFGEHQDYLGLPIIAAAISRRVQVAGRLRSDRQVIINMPDINRCERFALEAVIPYQHSRDYFKSAINLLTRSGLSFPNGMDVTVHGTIPINSGTSSSSALLVAWINWLLTSQNLENDVTLSEIGELAYRAEVLEFGEPGGMMDHFATAVGEVMYLESQPMIKLETFRPNLGTFVLGDSLEPKDTIGILKHVKYGMLEAIRKIRLHDADFSLDTVPQEAARDYARLLNAGELSLLQSNLSDRDVLREALAMFRTTTINHRRIGELLTIHQENLRDHKRVSTPKINQMIDESLKAGAYGAKINGSGGGGCMFAYAPEKPEAVAEAIERAGGKAHIIQVDTGTQATVKSQPISVNV
ncbi:galactokinase family protein [Larkinella insperata]|uniref:Galactokinase family protein n=1 Tax=Larkinella insperata TaxID=332158 RepID=A0ABW3Q3G1_9BACT|nr:galactokinase family protein [Larkinella insperata]